MLYLPNYFDAEYTRYERAAHDVFLGLGWDEQERQLPAVKEIRGGQIDLIFDAFNEAREIEPVEELQRDARRFYEVMAALVDADALSVKQTERFHRLLTSEKKPTHNVEEVREKAYKHIRSIETLTGVAMPEVLRDQIVRQYQEQARDAARN
jgi:hypothetical protein